MTDWEEHTESAPDDRAPRSFDLDIDFSTLPPPTSAELSPKSALHKLWPEQEIESRPPDLIVFDPLGYQVARDLRALGYPTRDAMSGVDVMGAIAAHPTAAVVCGPAEDAEQRRLLTAAIRLRFPEVPIVYASTHGRNPAAVRGALAEGAHVVVPLPLPPVDELCAALDPYVRPLEEAAPDVLGQGLHQEPPETVALQRDELMRLISSKGPTPPAADARRPPSQPVPSTTVPRPPTPPTMNARPPSGPRLAAPPVPVVPPELSDFDAATEVVEAPRVPVPPPPSSSMPLSTLPPASSVFMRRSDLPLPAHMPASAATAPPTLADRGVVPDALMTVRPGELGELLRAISPFLWGLDDAARYMDVRSAMGDVPAQGHQRTLKLLATLLRQLQHKVDESGL